MEVTGICTSNRKYIDCKEIVLQPLPSDKQVPGEGALGRRNSKGRGTGGVG